MPTFEKVHGDKSQRDVILRYWSGTYRGGSGFFVHEDGLIWIFGEDEFQTCAPLREHSAVFDCLHENSRLAAKLEREKREALLTDVASVDEGSRREIRLDIRDGGASAVELPGRGTRDGKRVTVASCGPNGYEQLTCKAGTSIIDLFWSILRAVPQAIGPSSCPLVSDVPEIEQGVPGWWVAKKTR